MSLKGQSTQIITDLSLLAQVMRCINSVVNGILIVTALKNRVLAILDNP